MEPEGSSTCSQEPSTGPYPEPHRSSPYHPISLTSSLILSTHLRLGLSSVFLSFWLSHQYAICIPRLTRPCYTPCPSHLSWLDNSNYVWRGVQVMKLLIMRFPSISRHFISLTLGYRRQENNTVHQLRHGYTYMYMMMVSLLNETCTNSVNKIMPELEKTHKAFWILSRSYVIGQKKKITWTDGRSRVFTELSFYEANICWNNS
jgi:hypothetical protein